VLHPQEAGGTSKTGEQDVSLLLDLDFYASFAKGLAELRGNGSPQQAVVKMTAAQLATIFKAAVTALKLESSGPPTLYHCRHGGPSADLAAKRRTMKEAQMRGRWQGDRSLRRYVRGGRIGEQLNRLPAASRRAAIKAARRIGVILFGGSARTRRRTGL